MHPQEIKGTCFVLGTFSDVCTGSLKESFPGLFTVALQMEHVLSTASDVCAISVSATCILPHGHTEVLKLSQNKASGSG